MDISDDGARNVEQINTLQEQVNKKSRKYALVPSYKIIVAKRL